MEWHESYVLHCGLTCSSLPARTRSAYWIAHCSKSSSLNHLPEDTCGLVYRSYMGPAVSFFHICSPSSHVETLEAQSALISSHRVGSMRDSTNLATALT